MKDTREKMCRPNAADDNIPAGGMRFLAVR